MKEHRPIGIAAAPSRGFGEEGVVMAKLIFVVRRRADMTREQCQQAWAGEQHTSIVEKLPGLRAWRQNHVASAPGEPICDGIGELWFESQEAMEAALESAEMAAAVEDAKSFLDMERTGMVIVEEKMIVG
jgi:uncharacterized protein (TIGR02118 family)